MKSTWDLSKYIIVCMLLDEKTMMAMHIHEKGHA